MAAHPMAAYWQSDEWAKLKVDLITVRGAKCEWCGKKREPSGLAPHHLNYDNFKEENPDDIVLICHKCHAIEHGKIKEKPKKKSASRANTKKPPSPRKIATKRRRQIRHLTSTIIKAQGRGQNIDQYIEKAMALGITKEMMEKKRSKLSWERSLR